MRYFINLFLLLSIITTISFAQNDIRSKELYLEYIDYPKRVFTNQKFHLTLKATVLSESSDFDNIKVTFINEYNLDILNRNPHWSQHDDSMYTTNLEFKAGDSNFELPIMTIALIRDDEIIEYLSIDPPQIKFEKIAINQKLFSNIIASQLNIMSIKTKQYDNKSLMSTINIEGLNSNLEDMNLRKYKDQGVESIEGDYEKQSVFYYVIIPIHEKQIKFTYYNIQEKDFVTVSIPINLKEELVSTQTNLNPYNDSMLLYKKAVIVFAAVIILILYFLTKRNRYLVFLLLFIFLLAYLFIPNKKITLNKGEKVYILPTNNSTVYKVIDKRVVVEIINEKDDYKKVLFKNQNIGWIKENDSK